MSRWTPLATALALLLGIQPAVLARGAPPAHGRSGLERRDLALVVKTLEDDPNLIDEMLTSDAQFKALATRFVPASRSRLAAGRALVGVGVVFMVLGALVGAPLYLARSDLRAAAIGTLAGAIGGGFALFVPGVAVMATPSAAEREMRGYWQDHRAGFLRPEAIGGPRLRLAFDRSLPSTAVVQFLSLSF
jgi:hypothetical protein